MIAAKEYSQAKPDGASSFSTGRSDLVGETWGVDAVTMGKPLVAFGETAVGCGAIGDDVECAGI